MISTFSQRDDYAAFDLKTTVDGLIMSELGSKKGEYVEKEVEEMLGDIYKIAAGGTSVKDAHKIMMHHLTKSGSGGSNFFAMMQGLLKLERLEMLAVLQIMCHESIVISALNIPLGFDGDDAALKHPLVEPTPTLSLRSLMKRAVLDSIMPAVLEGEVELETIDVLQAELKEVNEQKEQRDKGLASSIRSVRYHLCLLIAANKLPNMCECIRGNTIETWPLTGEGLLCLYALDRRGYNKKKRKDDLRNESHRDPKLITGLEIQYILLQLENIAADRVANLPPSKRFLQQFSKTDLVAAIAAAKEAMGGNLLSEVAPLTNAEARGFLADDEDEEDDTGGGSGRRSVSDQTRVRLQQSSTASADNRTMHDEGSKAAHYLVRDTKNVETLAASYALKDLENTINTMPVQNFSCAIPAFRALRKALQMNSLNGPEKCSDCPPTKVQAVLLVDEESRGDIERLQEEGKKPHVVAPGVLCTENLISKDLERNFMIAMSGAPFCIDGKTAANGHMRFAFQRHDNTRDMFPMMSVGRNKAIIGAAPLHVELLYMECNTQWQAIVTTCYNHHMCKILNVPEPKPDVGLRHSDLKLYLASIQPQTEGSRQVKIDRDVAVTLWKNTDWGQQDRSAGDSRELEGLFEDQIPGCTVTPVTSASDGSSSSFDERSTIDVVNSRDTKDSWGTHLIPYTKTNSLLFKAKAEGGFASHQDVSGDRGNQLSSPPYRRDFSGDGKRCFPEPKHIIVSTHIFQTENNKSKASVSWSEGRKLNASSHLATVMPGSRGNHTQGAEVNVNNTYHGVTPGRNGNGPMNKGGCRISCTARMAKDFTRELELAKEAHYRDGYGYTHCLDRSMTILREYNSERVFSGKPQLLPEERQKVAQLYYEVDPTARNYSVDDNEKKFDPRFAGLELPKQHCFQFDMLSPAQASLFHQHHFPPLTDATTGELVTFENISRCDLHEKRSNADSKTVTQFNDGIITSLAHGVAGIKKPIKLIGSKLSTAWLAHRATFQKILIENGHCSEIRDSRHTKKRFQPLHLDENYDIRLPGSTLAEEEFPMVTHDLRNAPTDAECPNILNKVRHYKNKTKNDEMHWKFWEKLQARLKACVKDNGENIEEAAAIEEIVKDLSAEFEELFRHPIATNLSGGSTQLSGGSGSGLANNCDHHYSTANAQSVQTEINTALYQMLQLKNAVCVFRNLPKMYELVNPAFGREKNEKRIPYELLSYYTAVSSESGKKTLSEVYDGTESEHFVRQSKQIEYFVADLINHSFQAEVPHVITLIPSWPLKTYVTAGVHQLQGKPRTVIQISEKDKRKIAVSVLEAQQASLQKLQRCEPKDMELLAQLKKKESKDLKAADFPISWITTDTVLDCFVEKEGFEAFKQHIMYDEAAAKFNNDMKVSVKAEDLAKDIVCVAAAQGARMARKGCIVDADKMYLNDGRTHVQHVNCPKRKRQVVVPLFLDGAEKLPFALREKCLPGCRDDDVNVCSNRHNFRVHHTWKMEKWKMEKTEWQPRLTRNKDAKEEVYHPPTLIRLDGTPCHLTIGMIGDMLFMSLASELTGNTMVMDLFAEWKESKSGTRHDTVLGSANTTVPLPNEESIAEFSHWLSAWCGGYQNKMTSVVSKQKLKTLPQSVIKTPATFANFLFRAAVAFVQPNAGMNAESRSTQSGLVYRCLQNMQCDPETSRHKLVVAVAETAANAGNVNVSEKLFFLSHLVVANLESFLGHFAGEVTIDSVFLGYGGKEGLDLLNLPSRWLNSGKTLKKKRKQRLNALHDLLVKYFTAARDGVRTAVGLGVKKKQLFWIGTGRTYSLTDTEHFCCKEYIISIHARPSRTISAAMRVWNSHSHPRPVPKEWDKALMERGKAKWKAFVELPEKDREYSKHLNLVHCAYVQEEEITEIIEKHRDSALAGINKKRKKQCQTLASPKPSKARRETSSDFTKEDQSQHASTEQIQPFDPESAVTEHLYIEDEALEGDNPDGSDSLSDCSDDESWDGKGEYLPGINVY